MKKIDLVTYRGFKRSEYNPCFRYGGIEWNVISG